VRLPIPEGRKSNGCRREAPETGELIENNCINWDAPNKQKGQAVKY